MIFHKDRFLLYLNDLKICCGAIRPLCFPRRIVSASQYITMLKDSSPKMKNVCFISGLEHRSVYLRMSGSGKWRTPQACAAVWRTRSTEEIHAWFKYPPTMHCSPLCPCSRACVKGGHKLQAVFMQIGAMPLPRAHFAASAAADAFCCRFVCKWLTPCASTCTHETIAARSCVLY